MNDRDKLFDLDDTQLLRQCRMETYRSSGPGGQHRNKVSSAVRLTHEAIGISAHGDDSRSQQDNKRLALNRLRMNIALQIRCPVDIVSPKIPPVVLECVFQPKGSPQGARRMQIGRKDRRFWPVAAFLLDALESCNGGLAAAAGIIGITTSNMASVIQSDRHLLSSAQTIRKKHGLGPIV